MIDRKTLMNKVYIMYFVMCIFALVILGKVFFIQIFEGEALREEVKESRVRMGMIQSPKGNIYAEDGRLLVTTVPEYIISMDPCEKVIEDERFNQNIDSLALCLSKLFGDKSKSEYKRRIKGARAKNRRYVTLQRHVENHELEKIKTFPLFRDGRFKGGLIVESVQKRKRPNGKLAERTIGYDRENSQPIGIEGKFRDEITGETGLQLQKRILGKWIPVDNDYIKQPIEGADLITSLDIDLQDVAETALEKNLKENDADHGCVILMEVETGYIKAIANLGKGKDGSYYEAYNYAFGKSTEPGSTFKLASLMVAIEAGKVNITDSVDLECGRKRYYDRWMRDSDEGVNCNKITVKKAFEISSNVGTITFRFTSLRGLIGFP